MSNKIIYLKSCDITLRHTLDKIADLEKNCYNINDLLALKSLIDVLEYNIIEEINNNSQDHLALCGAVQENINPELQPNEEQAKYVDSEYQLATSKYVNDLAKEILDIKAPFTNTQYGKLVKIEQDLMSDINEIIKNNDEIAEKVNALKATIETSNNNTPSLKEEAEAKKNSNKLNLKPAEKLTLKFESKITSCLTNSNINSESQTNKSKWLSKYNINYGLTGNDLFELIKLTNQINDLYASLNDTSDYVAMQLFANTVLNTVSTNINNVIPEERRATLESAIDNAMVDQPEIIQDKVRGLKSRLTRFSSDNYQFGEEDITILQNALNTANTELERLIAENDAIMAEIEAKTVELEEAKVTYEEKHEETPEIDPVNPNQDPKENTEKIDNIMDEINEVIDNELPYISNFELEYDDTEIGINEDPRLRVITITNIQPEYHKDAEFIVETSRPDTFTYTMENNEITVVATGTGDINLDVKAIIGEEEISKPVIIRVEKADITDFILTYDNETPMEVNEERSVAVEITPYWHKTTLFEIVKEENDDTFEVVSFSDETGNLIIKATGTGNISFIMKNGEIEKQVTIPVNIPEEPEQFTWYIGKNNFNESVVDGVYSYDFDPANLPVVHSIDEIYTDNQDIESTDANIYIICPKEWINQGWVNGVWTGDFKLLDVDNNDITLTYPDSSEPTIIGDLTILKSANTISDVTIKTEINENAVKPEVYYWYVGYNQDAYDNSESFKANMYTTNTNATPTEYSKDGNNGLDVSETGTIPNYLIMIIPSTWNKPTIYGQLKDAEVGMTLEKQNVTITDISDVTFNVYSGTGKMSDSKVFIN